MQSTSAMHSAKHSLGKSNTKFRFYTYSLKCTITRTFKHRSYKLYVVAFEKSSLDQLQPYFLASSAALVL